MLDPEQIECDLQKLQYDFFEPIQRDGSPLKSTGYDRLAELRRLQGKNKRQRDLHQRDLGRSMVGHTKGGSEGSLRGEESEET